MIRVKERWRSGALSVGSFRLLTAGQLASTVGDSCYYVALPWLVLSNHGSTVLLGALLACYGVPRTVLIPVGGVLTDKIGPRAVMLVADACRFVVVTVFTVFTARHDVSLVALGPLAALIGAGEGVFLPASKSILPSLLGEDQLLSGNSVFSAGMQVGMLVGPAIGGVLVTSLGPVQALTADAASFGLSALSIALIRPRVESVTAAKTTTAAGAADGGEPEPARPPGGNRVLRLLRESRPLQVIFVVSLAANFLFTGLLEVALPTLIHERWAASGYGLVLTAMAIGALLGSLGAARARGLRRPMVVSGLMLIAMAGAVALTPFLGGIIGAGAAMLTVGLCSSFSNVLNSPTLQKSVPPELLGRTMSILMLCAYGSQPLAVAIVAVLVRNFGPTACFPVAGTLIGIVVVWALAQRDWRDFGAKRDSAADESPAIEAAVAE